MYVWEAHSFKGDPKAEFQIPLSQGSQACVVRLTNFEKHDIIKRSELFIFEKAKAIKMDKRLIQNRITESIKRSDSNAVAYLFGSRARGDFQIDSDWDILILVDEQRVTNEIEDKFRDELYDIELESGQIISTFIYPKKYWENTLVYSPLYKNVQKEGVLL